MVREAEVEAAAVDLELGAEVLLRHRRALDVPARASGPPGRVPLRVLVCLRRLPEGEVAGVFLQVARLLGDHVVRLRARERAVRGIGRHAEVDVAAGLVGEPAVDQLADESDDLRDDLGRARLDVGPAEPELVGVVDVPLRRLLGQLGAPHLLPRGRLVDLVVDVRDVLDELDLVAALGEPLPHPHRDDERPRVPDVDPLVHRRAADVHADRARRRGQLDLLPRGRVVQEHRALGYTG